MTKPSGRIGVALSGGVDSSVAAYLLHSSGHEVVGIFMKNWEGDEETCPALQDLKDAEGVCQKLGIPFHAVNFSAEYWEWVFEDFLQSLREGFTPNPDVLCNRHIKFKVLWDYAQAVLGCSHLATGHYARLTHEGDRVRLFKAVDQSKDQTYFLHALHPSQLTSALFPLGGLTKVQVRRLAEEQGFLNARKPDSTGICFIGEKRFDAFVSRYLPYQPGAILDGEGRLLGEHKGLQFYTLGQRKGLGIGGMKGREGQPWFVVEKRLKENQLIVSQDPFTRALWPRACTVSQLSWLSGTVPFKRSGLCEVKVRYRQREVPCRLSLHGKSAALVEFLEPVRAVTPGQYAVFYSGEEVLGGGVIRTLLALPESSRPSKEAWLDGPV